MAMRYVIAMIFAALFALAATLFVSTPIASLVVRNQVFESPDEVAMWHVLIFMGSNLVGLAIGWGVGWWFGGRILRQS